MSDTITWRVDFSINSHEALAIGEHESGDEVLYVISADGSCECSAEDTDGDFGGAGWPSPPRLIYQEALELASSWEVEWEVENEY